MTKTQNLNLPQWEANDPIRREDFNEAFQNVEKMRYSVGTYIGNGLTEAEGGVFVETGFRPRFVIISRARVMPTNPNSTIILGDGHVDGTESYIVFQDTGFQVYYLSVYGTNYTPLKLNESGLVYSYAAFQ